MKIKYNRVILILVLGSIFAPGLLLPQGGLATLRAQCRPVPGPPTPNKEQVTPIVFPDDTDNGSGTHNGSSGQDPTPTQVTGTSGGGGRPGNSVPFGFVGADVAAKPNATANMVNGSYIYSVTDLTVPGIIPLGIKRCYVSSIAYDGPIGYNGDFNYNRSLELQSGLAYYHTGRGFKVQLNYPSGGGTSTAQSVGSIHLSMASFSSSTGLATLIPQGLRGVTGIDSGYNGYVVTDTHGNSDIFDANGYLGYSVDRNGNALVYSRDAAGGLIKVEDPVHGTFIAFTLDDNGRIISATDSMGRTVSYAYDSSYDLNQVTYPATTAFPSGTTIQYGNDLDGRMTSIIDQNGNTVVSNTYGDPGSLTEFSLINQTVAGGSSYFTYPTTTEVVCKDNKTFETDYYNDGNDNIVKVIVNTQGLHSGAPATYETDSTYDTNNQLIGATYPNGNTAQWTYDSNGNVLTMTNSAPSGSSVDSTKGTQSLTSVTTYTYESRFNQVATITDSNGNVTTCDYGTSTSNPPGNLLSVTAPTVTAGTAQTTFTYNEYGQVLTVTAPDGTVTQNTYDGSTGYLTQTIKDYGSGKLNATTQFTYDAYGHMATVEDPNGNTATITTDAMNRVTEVDGPLSEVVQSTYDAVGHVLTTQKKLDASDWQKVANVYNSYEQLTATQTYTGSSTYLTTSYTYDLNGNQITVTDPLSHTTTMAYDERDLPYLKTDALGNTTQTDFDGDGNTAKLTDELGHVTTYTYDGLDRCEEKTFADSSYQTWTYDAGGRVTSQRTTAGNTITGTYDARNELVTENYGSTITNTYDIMGRLLTATEGGAALTYAYDDLGRATSFTDQAGHTSTYTYDLDGNRLSAAYPTGVTANVVYDALGRATTLQDVSNTTLASFTYDTLDRITGVSLANGTSITPSFDLLNRVSSLNNTLTSTNRNYSYVYDNASRVTSITEPRGTVSIGSYSDRDEVKGITEPSGSPFSDQSFAYDAGFNRSSWTMGTTTTSYTANNLNQYTAVGSATPTWNTDGGLAAFSGNTYTYDALGRLTQVSNALGIYLYSYDPFGRRVKKVLENTGGTVLATYTYHYDGSQVAVEYQPSDTWTYYGGVMRTDGTNKQWYYFDAQGSVSAVADNSGNVLEAYEYTAQGHFQITNGSGTVLTGTAIGNSLMYAGYYYDAESGNYFCNARYYSPKLGRFISRDPLSGAEFSQGTNLYAYCGNNCANGIDPSGMANETPYNTPLNTPFSVTNGYAGSGIYQFEQSNTGGFREAKIGGPASAAVSTTGPQNKQNPNATGKGVVWSGGGAFFFGLGGGGGVELVSLVNGLHQWYIYAEVGAGMQFSAGAQAGVVNHVGVPADYAGFFWAGQAGAGVMGSTVAVTPSAPISGANSASFGPGVGVDLGVSTSARYYLPIGSPF